MLEVAQHHQQFVFLWNLTSHATADVLLDLVFHKIVNFLEFVWIEAADRLAAFVVVAQVEPTDTSWIQFLLFLREKRKAAIYGQRTG